MPPPTGGLAAEMFAESNGTAPSLTKGPMKVMMKGMLPG
jgi:hypothetical protein